MAIRITFDSNIIDLEIDSEALATRHSQERNQNRSASGKIEQINRYGIQEMAFAAILSEAVYRQLWAWWAWARQGEIWSFALDSDAGASTTLDDAAASGQKNVPLTSTTGFSAGDICLIRAEDEDDEFELVVIDSVDPGVKIVAESNLIFSYSADDTFRHRDYWPAVISLDTEFNPKKEGSIYRHTFRFIEAL